MDDGRRTRAELIEEMKGLRARLGEMERSDRFVRILQRFAPDVIYYLDAEGRIEFITGAVRLLGYDPEELIGKPLDLLVHPDDRERAHNRYCERRVGERATKGLEVRLLTKGGELRDYASNVVPVVLSARGMWDVPDEEIKRQDKTFLGTLGMARDVTELKRAQEELKRARDELEVLVRERTAELSETSARLMPAIAARRRAEEARTAAERELETQRALSIRADRLRSLGQMAAGVAHELNQPLVGVRGLAEHLLLALDRGWELNEEKVRDKIRKIVEQADRMDYIIQHVRNYAREAGSPEERAVQVNEVVRSSMEMMGAQFRARGVGLECELAEGLPDISANPFAIEEVVLNLLTNARDAVEEKIRNGAQPPHQVTVRTWAEDGPAARRVSIRVADSGVGIPPEMFKRVFEPFFTTMGPDRGMGLGLALSKSIVEAFKGTIEMESTEGKGTAATVSFPARG